MSEKTMYSRVLAMLFLIIVLYPTYLILQLRCRNSKNEVTNVRENLNLVLSQLNALQQRHNRLIAKLRNIPEFMNTSQLQFDFLNALLQKKRPTVAYENTRRRIYSNTKELWYYMKDQLRNMLKEKLNSNERLNVLNEVANRKRSILLDQERLTSLDGFEEWREREAASLSDLIQRRLQYLQNPPSCAAAKTLICRHEIYGFGCALHHTAYCLVNAYALQRTLIFTNIKWWHPIYKWTNIFYPISDTCTRIKNKKVSTYEIHKSNASTVYLPVYRDHGHNNPPAFPYHIPKDLAQRMIRLNGDPYSWWIGQILKYIIRLQRLDVINETIKKTQFKSPIVGVHIRRTDKIVVEAKAYDIEEYMFHVEDYYKKLELTSVVDQRRVYLATDNTSVMQEAIKKYPQYTFYGDYFKAEMAKLSSRYTTEALSGFLVDLYILSQCDHVVCTFSSNVGRMAYELMQADRLDAVTRITSLDHYYYFTTDEQRYRIAVMRHKNMSLEASILDYRPVNKIYVVNEPPGYLCRMIEGYKVIRFSTMLSLIGDIIDYKTCNETSLGTNTRTGQIGRIPWYKTEEHIIQKSYPEYKNVPIL